MNVLEPVFLELPERPLAGFLVRLRARGAGPDPAEIEGVLGGPVVFARDLQNAVHRFLPRRRGSRDNANSGDGY